ncbi:hypothetical protein [Knoellia sp. Soil729]|uniref:hypothetical protein n=1 Tax=Knoellia sp. Soil729 TaxID=1736394 RepID=UPI0006F8FBC1|nr:hypothetical protein [Knoellia sp. Soil729]KRE42938.1 hypothetical protein ASG74_11355 [Knoellia sp. Soil729]
MDVPLTVHLHLAMDGAVSVRRHHRALDGPYPRTAPPIHGNVAWRLLSASHHAEVTDPAVCELLDEDGVLALRARLGPDPLREDAEPDVARRRIQNSRRPIGALLTDQKVRYAVYGRAGQPCHVCGMTVRVVLMGRQRMFWCPGCQHA